MAISIIEHRRGWHALYDETGKKYKTLSENVGSFVSIAGNTFVMKRNIWLDTYNIFGEKINTRSAH